MWWNGSPNEDGGFQSSGNRNRQTVARSGTGGGKRDVQGIARSGTGRSRPASSTGIRRDRLARPRSACAMLRGESGLSPLSHRDAFLQDVENKQIKRERSVLRRETFQVGDWVDSFDPLHDPYLADLRTLHNKEARRKRPFSAGAIGTTPAPRTPTNARRSPKKGPTSWEDLTPAERLSKLKAIMESDFLQGKSLRESAVDAPQGQFPNKDKNTQITPGQITPATAFQYMLGLVLTLPERELGQMARQRAGTADSQAKAEGNGAVSSQLGSKSPSANARDLKAISSDIHMLLELLLQRFGSLREAFSVLDVTGSGKIAILDWESGLRAIGYQGGQARDIFKHMDSQDTGHLTMMEFKALEPFLQELLTNIQMRRTALSQGLEDHQRKTSTTQPPPSLLLNNDPKQFLSEDPQRREDQLVRQRRGAMPAVTAGSRKDVSTLRELKLREQEMQEIKETRDRNALEFLRNDLHCLFAQNKGLHFEGYNEKELLHKERKTLSMLFDEKSMKKRPSNSEKRLTKSSN